MMFLRESFVEVLVEVVADDEKRNSYQGSWANFDQEPDTAV